MSEIRLGRYQHYKGKFYEVLGVARHSETKEELIVYKALYKTEFGENSWWVRPKEMFVEKVFVNGQEVLRFSYVGQISV